MDIKVELCSHWGDDRAAAEAAWASSTDKSKLEGKSDSDVRRMVSGLVVHHHDTPKERIWLEFFITCPIFVERQVDKYRLSQQYQDFKVDCEFGEFGRLGITQNELSGRYRTIPERAYGLPRDVAAILIAAQPTITQDPNQLINQVTQAYEDRLDAQHESYQAALIFLKAADLAGRITNAEYKRAREVLRGELGTAYLTDMRWVLNLNALEHVINQRLAPEAQMESRVVAYLMLKAIRDAQVAPALIEAMITVNKWEVWGQEVQAWLERENVSSM